MLILLVMSCNEKSEFHEGSFKVKLLVESYDSAAQTYFVRLIIENFSDRDVSGKDWNLFYNHIGGKPESFENVEIETIAGSYFKLSPKDKKLIIPAGGALELSLNTAALYRRVSFLPTGMILLIDDQVVYDGDPEISYFPNGFPEVLKKEFGFPDSEFIYRQNLEISKLDASSLPVLPTPVVYNQYDESVVFDFFKISYDKGLQDEANHLGQHLSKINALPISLLDLSEEGNLNLRIDYGIKEHEGYKLEILPEGKIEIRANSAAGIFYGTQSLLSLVSRYDEVVTLPVLKITDYPRFPYRGMHIDVARNFKSKETILNLIELMSMYKLNRLNLQLTDDEGWRLDVKGLPELTEVGGRRGFTEDESDMLFPAFGSGAMGDSESNGFYTRADLVEILEFAKNHHIEVIPKIDFPGHARAAIKAMEVRYNRYMKAGEETKANEFLLSDPNDRSSYKSIQDFNDNVVNICSESVYHFLDVVIDDLNSVFEEAGVKLNIVHIGGDEVPEGVWTDSPICDQLSAEKQEINDKNSKFNYFIERVSNIIAEKGLIMAGWEEIAMDEKEGEKLVPNPQFKTKKFLPYVWHKEYAYPLVNEGFSIILANADRLYFDLAYNDDPMEPGLVWAGTNDASDPYLLDPMKLTDEKGKLMELKNPQNILGLQGQLWGETLRTNDKVGYYLIPKIFGLAERAWSAPENETEEQALEGLHLYYNQIGLNEFSRVSQTIPDFSMRMPKPGVIIDDSLVYANVRYPGLEIRYTQDGSEPDESSTLYVGPFKPASSVLKFKSFLNKHNSAITEVKYEEK